MEKQVIPIKEIAPRACGRCQYRDVLQPKPPELKGATICRWGPRQITQFPSPAGIMNLSNFPQVTDDDWCYQFKEIEKGA